MNGNIYQQKPLAAASFFQKLFKQLPQENAVVELNNLLAVKPLLSVSQKDVKDIEIKYQLSLHKEFKLNLEEFYAVYLNHCFTDKVLSDEEIDELKHLKYILNLDQYCE